MLINICSEKIFAKALPSFFDGIIINELCINNLRYTDDTVILADSSDSTTRPNRSIGHKGKKRWLSAGTRTEILKLGPRVQS